MRTCPRQRAQDISSPYDHSTISIMRGKQPRLLNCENATWTRSEENRVQTHLNQCSPRYSCGHDGVTTFAVGASPSIYLGTCLCHCSRTEHRGIGTHGLTDFLTKSLRYATRTIRVWIVAGGRPGNEQPRPVLMEPQSDRPAPQLQCTDKVDPWTLPAPPGSLDPTASRPTRTFYVFSAWVVATPNLKSGSRSNSYAFVFEMNPPVHAVTPPPPPPLCRWPCNRNRCVSLDGPHQPADAEGKGDSASERFGRT